MIQRRDFAFFMGFAAFGGDALVSPFWARALAAPVSVPDDRSALPRSIDLSRYFPSRKAALAELDGLRADASALASAAPPGALGAYLENADRLVGKARRLSVYFTILSARNIDDQAAQTAADKTHIASQTIMDKVRVAVLATPSRSFAVLAKSDLRLRRFGYLETQSRARAAHELPPGEAAIAGHIAQPTLDAYWTLYQKIGRIPVESQAGQSNSLAKTPDRARREAAWREKWREADSKTPADATILLAIVRLNEAMADAEGFPDAPSAGYFAHGLDRATVDRTLSAIRADLPLYQRYQRFTAAQVTRTTGIAAADVRPWDMGLTQGGLAAPFAFDQVREIIPAALSPLGRDYVDHFSALLAPSSGRLDIGAVVGKRESGGFSVSAPGVPSGLYMASFDGSLNDGRVVAHEGGHAVAAQLANEGGSPSIFARGPNWLMESYAILNELLLYDYLARTSPAPAERQLYGRALVNDMMFQVFGSAEEATLEQEIYDQVSLGKIQSETGLNSATYKIMRQFEPWPDDILRSSSSLWSTKRLMFQDPFYLVNYLFAGIVAINLFDHVKSYPDTFPGRYEALLRRGYDASPFEMLAPLLGNRQSTETLAATALEVMEDQLGNLVRLTDGTK